MEGNDSTFYRAILQNLFFGTLNQRMNTGGQENRRFANDGSFLERKDEYGVKNLYRYQKLFAIAEEEAAVQFYTRLAKKMEAPAMRETLLKFAAEEQKHKDKLLAVSAGEAALGSGGDEVTDLKVSDYMADVRPTLRIKWPPRPSRHPRLPKAYREHWKRTRLLN